MANVCLLFLFLGNFPELSCFQRIFLGNFPVLSCPYKNISREISRTCKLDWVPTLVRPRWWPLWRRPTFVFWIFFWKNNGFFYFFNVFTHPMLMCNWTCKKKSSLYSLSEGQCLYFIFLEFSCSLTGGWNATERANDFLLYIALHDGQRLPIIYISWKFSRTFMLSKNISPKLCFDFFKCVHSPNADVQLNMQTKFLFL